MHSGVRQFKLKHGRAAYRRSQPVLWAQRAEGDFAVARMAIWLSFSPPAVVLTEVLPPPEKQRSVKWLQQTGTGWTGVSLHGPCCSQRGFGTGALREDWQQGGQLCLGGEEEGLQGLKPGSEASI